MLPTQKIIKIKIKENEIWVRALVEAQNYAVNALRVAMREITIVSYRILKKFRQINTTI